MDFYERYLKGKEISDLRFIEDMRKIKDKEEIKRIRKAVKVAEDAIKEIDLEGKTEREVAASLEYFIKKKAEVAFNAVVASGRNSAIPHHKPSDRRIKPGEPVIIDFGARIDNYNSDLSRTISSDSEVYAAVEEAQRAGVKECFEGNEIKNADLAVREVLRKHGLEEYFLHSSGHGIGLEVHEPPKVSKDVKGRFERGMVVTIEPGVYRDSGIRIEDMVLIGKKPKILSRG